MSLVHTDAIVINGQQVYTVRLILMNAKTRASVVKVSAITIMWLQIVTIQSGKDTSVFAGMGSKVILACVTESRRGVGKDSYSLKAREV